MSSGATGRPDRVQAARAHAAQQRRALDQLVARGGVEAPLRRGAAGVARAPDALEERREAARRADLASQLDRADVDAELERRGGHQDFQVARPQPGLQPQAAVLRQAAVVGRDLVLADALGQQVGEPLGEPAGVHEHERGAVLGHVAGDPVEDLSPLLVRGDRLERGLRQLDRQVERAAMAEVDDRARRGAGRVGPSLARADQQSSDGLDRPLRRGEADALGAALAERVQALERERQVRAALVAGHGVDLVDDDRPHAAQPLAALAGGHEQVERLRRGDEQVRRALQHRCPRRRRGVAGAQQHPHLGHVEAELVRGRPDLGERGLEVLLDVGGESLQGRHVDDLGAVVRAGLVRRGTAQQAIDRDEERGERLARAGGRGDQRVAARGDRRPARGLGLRRAQREAPLEPGADGGMEAVERGHASSVYQGRRAARRRPALRVSGIGHGAGERRAAHWPSAVRSAAAG